MIHTVTKHQQNVLPTQVVKNKVKHKLTNIIILFAILVLGFFLRVYKLAEIPSGFFCDEASIGYNAYTILHRGKDEYEEPYPFFFKSFGDYRHPIAIYSTIPFIAIFGLTETSVKIQAIMYGVFLLLLLYFLGKALYSESLGLWISFIGAIMPWLIHYNRTGFEFSVYATFFTLTLLLFIKSLKKSSYIIPAFCSLSLTFYTYQPAKLIVLLFFLGVLVLLRNTFLKNKNKTILGIILFFILSIPLIISFLNGQAFARFNQVSLLSENISTKQIIIKSFSNYFVQLSPAYFFTTGEQTFITRHFIGGLTPVLIVSAPFLLLGLFYVIKSYKNPVYQLILFLIIGYPISGAVVANPPFTSRSIIGAPLCALLIGIGVLKVVTYNNFTRQNIFKINLLILFLFLVNTYVFTNFYFFKYPLYSSDYWGWQYGPKHIIAYFVENESKYDNLYMIPEFNGPDIFFKFYAPNECRKCGLGTPDSVFDPNTKQLFAVTPKYLLEHPSYQFNTLKTIYYPNKNIAFQIGEIVQ